MEKGVSTGTGSMGLNVAVSMKKVSSREKRSTIGVMSTLGDLPCILIFGIFYILSFLNQKNQTQSLFPD